VDDLDPQRLADALTRLLMGRTDSLRLAPDAEGWFQLAEVCAAISDALARPVLIHHVATITRTNDTAVFELVDSRIRLIRPRRGAPPVAPDVLFHATTVESITAALAAGVLVGAHRKRLMLSDDEGQAWRVAHRLAFRPGPAERTRPGQPFVAIIDVPRARRAGARFLPVRPGGLFSTPGLPTAHVLNLRPDFDVQLSAGGIPVARFPDGQLRMALVRVTRRWGRTWEVAKGKLEPGETPEMAAAREVQEEMGTEVGFDVLRYVGPVRYGFLAPGGAPRLKTVFLYLLAPQGPMTSVRPAHHEGIGEVAWFTPDEAVAAVSHPSLQPAMRLARDLVVRYGTAPEHHRGTPGASPPVQPLPGEALARGPIPVPPGDVGAPSGGTAGGSRSTALHAAVPAPTTARDDHRDRPTPSGVVNDPPPDHRPDTEG
jgi:8-oxo-dGTP pyrophosphatase MutT (NUDIX family)/RNA:NAD 2'-phosphotransferase (TPT1/KptA family)